jgi:hypothetical protein
METRDRNVLGRLTRKPPRVSSSASSQPAGPVTANGVTIGGRLQATPYFLV